MSKKPSKRKPPTLSGLKKRAWKLLSECIRREAGARSNDYGRIQCYTCGHSGYPKDMQAGHAIPGRTGATLLDEEIIRPQDARCNIWGRGMYHIFAPKLIQEKADASRGQWHTPEQIAIEWWEQKLISTKQVKKWTRPELEQKIADYKERLSRLDPN